MDKNFLALIQFCDSNFPTGSFTHSFGLETYIQKGNVDSPEDFAKWLDVYLSEQLVNADGLAIKMIYDDLESGHNSGIWHVDRLLTMQNVARETREGSQQMGRHMVKITKALYDIPLVNTYHARIRKKEAFGHPAVVFALVSHYLGVSCQTALLYYYYSIIMGLVQNAVRAIPIGQTAGQKIISDFQEKMIDAARETMELSDIDFGSISPGIELSQMQHEHVNVRIFMS